MRINSFVLAFALSGFVCLCALPAFTQSSIATGKLKIHVHPKQAYVFVDGKSIRDGSQTITLTPGQHSVGIYNYGYTPQTQSVTIAANKTVDMNVALTQTGDKVTGPFGDIELKGHPRAAVFLNGTTPAYFVGHVDEFDNNWGWHQWLLVRPGTYQVTVSQLGETIWSGPVDVKAGQRQIVFLNHDGKIESRKFNRGLTIGPQPRFEAGIASAIVPIAPVTAQFSASQAQTSCGQSAMLNWKATDAADTSITNIGNVPSTGDQSVSPKQTTTYELVAKGPGGEATRTETIDVNAQPAATIAFSQPEVRYRKVGDKVVEQDSAVLTWSTADGSIVSISPLGNVPASGSRTIEAAPNQSTTGPVNQDVTYTLRVANACGGTTTKTATLHVVGSIEPPPSVTLASIFYPTRYPERRHANVGLLPSQKQELAQAAATFKAHEMFGAQNELMIVGHADVRGSRAFNLALSQRRAELVKDYLVSQGVPADKIEIRADGKSDQLPEVQVLGIQSHDPQPPQKWMMHRKADTWLAYNRRVDIILEPTGQESTTLYPNDAPGARILWERSTPSLKAVESASTNTHAGELSQANNSAN